MKRKQKRNKITDQKISSFLLIAALVIFQANPLLSSFAFAEGEESGVTTSTEVVVESNNETSTQTEEPHQSPSSEITATSSTESSVESEGEFSTSTSTQEASTSTTYLATSTESLSTNSTAPFISTGTTTIGEVIISTTTEELLNSLATTTSLDVTYASSTDGEEGTSGDLPVGTTTIATGDAVALANILNIVNTNLINSTGSIIMANMVDGYTGDIDLRSSTSSASSSCSLLSCGGVDSITAKIDANADIDNAIAVVASSGTNDIETASAGQIFSGDTFAGLNLVNVANTTLIDSKYFLLSLNSFNSINGDIVLPSLYSFFGTSTPAPHLDNVTIAQDGVINNDLNVDANSGSNTTTSVYGETHTGNSITVTNLYNSLNSLLLGGNSVALLLKISGKWMGELFGAPTGASFVQDGDMRVLAFENGAYIMDSALGEASIYSTSTGRINNDIDVLADSGKNTIKDTKNALIETGDSIAAANIINIANTNVIGRNWVLAIINVFGDLNGNISFGKPDMWLGEQVNANESFITNGTILTYTITLVNRGDSIANTTIVSSQYDKAHLDLIDSSIPYTENTPGTIVFDTTAFVPGESKTITFTARIKDSNPGTDIVNTATVTSHEPDNNLSDNTDTTTITTSIPTIGGGDGNNNGGGNNTTPPTITPITPKSIQTISISSLTVAVVRDTPSLIIAGAGTTGEERIRIKNLTSSYIQNVVFDDVLYDVDGNELRRETFELGDILPDEEITITYDVSFSEAAPSGIYKLGSILYQTGRNSLAYPNNGTINYTSFGQGGGEEGELIATSTPLTPLKATTTPRKVIRSGSVLGAFIEAPLGVSVAKAEVAGVNFGEGNITYSLIYLLLFILAALMRMYYKHIRSKA